jgi:regulator of sigma E protease
MSWVLTFLGIIALIIIHELGHFAVAKWVGMRVERFSLFFPPILFSVRRGETEYSIGALPLGGYVKIGGMAPVERMPRVTRGGAEAEAAEEHEPSAGMLGELAGDPMPDDPRAYFNQPVWKRVAVIAAGPAMNVILAFAILWGVYTFSAQTPVNDRARVASVQSGSAAASVLRPGDQLLAVEGVPVRFHKGAANITHSISSHRCAGLQVQGCVSTTPVRLTILRDGKRMTVVAYPHYDAKEKRMLLGFSYAPALRRDSLGQALTGSVGEMWHVASLTVSNIGSVLVSEHARKEVHSIVGASDLTSEAFTLSLPDALFILALLSLTLAIVNLFPFLPLDGGHIFWALAEKVRGHAIPFSVMERASLVGILLVGFIFVIGLTNDIHSLSNGSLKLHH